MNCVRITSIPRETTPGAGFHPMFFAQRRGDIVWATPGRGSYAGEYDDITYCWFEGLGWNAWLPVRVMQILALLSMMIRLLRREQTHYVVHSLMYSIPFRLTGKSFSVVIHGSDGRHLDSYVGRWILAGASYVAGVGFGVEKNGISIARIGNVFDIRAIEGSSQEKVQYDVLFVLRDAPVKNPEYPAALFRELGMKLNLRIAVVGIDRENMGADGETSSETPGGSSIVFLGRQPFENVLHLMSISKILMIPSHSEGISKAMLESMAAGMHVMINRCIDLPPEFVPQVVQFSLSDWDGIAKTLSSLMRMDGNLENQVFVRSYVEKTIKELDQVYASMVP